MLKRILIGVLLLLLIAAGVAAWRLRPRSRSFYTDADSIKRPIETVQPRDILWRPPAKLPDLLRADGDVGEPQLSADGLTLFFARGRPGQNADIYSSRKTSEGWSPPEQTAEINSEFDELGPELSADGRSLFFYSDRPGGTGGYDIWVTHRGQTEWAIPQNLGPNVNSEFDEYGPGLSPDGRTLYFASDRPQSKAAPSAVDDVRPPTMPGETSRRNYDLYSASMTAGEFGAATPIEALNTQADEGAPSISPAGDFFYFCSDRSGGHGGFDIYRARWLRGKFLAPVNLGETVNTAANELDPAVTLGGYGLHFSSNRSASAPSKGESDGYDLYYTSSREVFSEAESYRAKIDWAALWSQIGSNVLWALLALLLLGLLLALMRDLKDGKLALLTKCLLASLTAHLLLMLLLNFWQVTVGLVDALSNRRSIQVALASPARADIAEQINGSLTDSMDVDTASVPVEQRVEPIETEPVDSAVTMAVERTTLNRPEPSNNDELITEADRPAPAPAPLESEPATVADATPVEVDLPDDAGHADAIRESALEIAHAQPPSTDTAREHPDARAEVSPDAAMAAMTVEQHASEPPESIADGPTAIDTVRPEADAPEPTAIPIESAVAFDVDALMEEAPIASDETDSAQVASRLEPVEASRTESRIPTTQPALRVVAVDAQPTEYDVIDKAIGRNDLGDIEAVSEAA
ncbi:MAG: hypothetical protein O7D94_10065, partial [Planctomycetota bacterium]|nr:hypothetical protein [Planctomycetota bacterium]